jgi:hypothetical protein
MIRAMDEATAIKKRMDERQWRIDRAFAAMAAK